MACRGFEDSAPATRPYSVSDHGLRGSRNR